MLGMTDARLDRRTLADADASCSDVDAESDWLDREEEKEHLAAGKRRVGTSEAFHRGRRKKVRGQEVDCDREMMMLEDPMVGSRSTQSLGGMDYRSNSVHDDMSAEEDQQSRASSQRILGNPQAGTGKLRPDSGGGRDKETLRTDYKILHARYTKLKGRHSKLKVKYAKLKAAHTQCLVQKLKRGSGSRQDPSSTHGGSSSREQASSNTTDVHEAQQTFVCSQLQRFDLSS
jgi:hypothetical protein